MSVQFAAFRANFARQMEDYRERRVRLIRAELERRGEDEHDLAHAVKAHPRTGERWVSTGAIQRQYRKPVADYLGLAFDELFPDLAVEEEQLRAQLAAIEDKLDLILDALGVSPAGAVQALATASRETGDTQAASAQTPPATKKRRAAG